MFKGIWVHIGTLLRICFIIFVSITDLARTLGDSRSEQRHMKEDRLRAKKQLIADRKQEGLSLNEALLESILDEEERQTEQKRKWVCVIHISPSFDQF